MPAPAMVFLVGAKFERVAAGARMAGEAFGEFLEFGGPAKALFRRANPATTYHLRGKPLAHLLFSTSIKTPLDDVRVGLNLLVAHRRARGGFFNGNYPKLIPSKNMMLLWVFLSLPSSSSIASTGGTPVRARRRRTTLVYSSG